jgi:uncharacterized membrane protein
MTAAIESRHRFRGTTVPFWISLAAFVVCGAAWLLLLRQGLPPSSNLIAALLPILAVVSTIAGLARALPLGNAVMTAVFVAVGSSVIQAFGVKTGIPFGAFAYTANLGPRMLSVLPWPAPLLWVVILLNSRSVARLVLRPSRNLRNPGLWTISLASLLAVAADLSLEPFAVNVGHFWTWRAPRGIPAWYTAPWFNFLGWGAAAFLVLAFATPWLINKRPGSERYTDHAPLALWLAVNLFLVVANASQGLQKAVVFGLVTSFVVAAFALRGARAVAAS